MVSLGTSLRQFQCVPVSRLCSGQFPFMAFPHTGSFSLAYIWNNISKLFVVACVYLFLINNLCNVISVAFFYGCTYFLHNHFCFYLLQSEFTNTVDKVLSTFGTVSVFMKCPMVNYVLSRSVCMRMGSREGIVFSLFIQQ